MRTKLNIPRREESTLRLLAALLPLTLAWLALFAAGCQRSLPVTSPIARCLPDEAFTCARVVVWAIPPIQTCVAWRACPPEPPR